MASVYVLEELSEYPEDGSYIVAVFTDRDKAEKAARTYEDENTYDDRFCVVREKELIVG